MNRLKQAQLFLHHHYNAIRHWAAVVIGIILLIFSMIMIGNQNRLINQIRDLSGQNKVLAQDNKKLNQDNQNIAKQNRSYTRCIATIFAQYTYDFVPVTIIDLDKCTLDSNSRSEQRQLAVPGTSDTKSSAPQASSPGSSSSGSSSSPKSTPSPDPEQPDNSQPLLDCKVDLLGIHIGCP